MDEGPSSFYPKRACADMKANHLTPQTPPSFHDDLQIDATPIWQLLLAAGLLLAFTSDLLLPAAWSHITHVGLLLTGGVLAAWLLRTPLPRLSRWLTVGALTSAIGGAYVWIDDPILLALLVLPPVLAVALLGLPAGVAWAGAETFALIGLSFWRAISIETAVVLVTLWAVVAMIAALLRAIHRVAGWSWASYEQTREELSTARDRQLQLNQALADLAHVNEQLTRLNQLAQGLRQVAEDARGAKEQFVANVSHELRTPLNMIIGFSEIILQTPESYGARVPPALLADLAVIHRNAEHLSALIDDVLDLSQIEMGEMALARTPVDMAALIANVVTAARPLFESKRLYLHAELPPHLPLVECDATRIREVLLNLLSNAGRFTEAGGIQITARLEPSALVIAVADTGSGIPADGLAKLFQPFFQLDGSIRRRYGGTGLGLSICKRFIELHNGKIWVESAPGHGATFSFSLPLPAAMPEDTRFLRGLTPDWEHHQRTRPSAAPLTTVRPRFVVLDAANVLPRLMTRYLDHVEIAPVADFAAAQAELARTPAHALLVNTLSIGATLDQLNLAAALPPGAPALLCSIPGLDHHALEAGATHLLVKPVTREALLAALDRLDVGEGPVLVVDDEPDALQLFGRMLATTGRDHRVLLARDGHEALAILADVRPAVILLDLIMPNMDGFQLLAARSRDPALQTIPVIIVSAQDPTRQPIVSNALAITQGGGLSMRQLLKSIEFISTQLTPLATQPEMT